MIESLLFPIAVAGIVVVIVWCVQNDKLSDDEPTTGLLAMKKEKPTESAD